MAASRGSFIVAAALCAMLVASTSSAVTVDPILFNASTNNTLTGDEAPGLSGAFTVSSRVGNDDPEGAFGVNNAGAPIEPNSFIFGDGGTADNGDAVFGNGGEVVDFLSWTTTSPVDIVGYEIRFEVDSNGSGDRGTQLVRFLIEGMVVDQFDNGALSATTLRLLPAQFNVDDFRIEITRNNGQGPRLVEINAVVPEPASGLLLLLGASGTLGMAIRRRAKAA